MARITAQALCLTDALGSEMRVGFGAFMLGNRSPAWDRLDG
jgi:hypothetical protein